MTSIDIIRLCQSTGFLRNSLRAHTNHLMKSIT
jgi:hypothetical protein